jgi:hypothetical protein
VRAAGPAALAALKSASEQWRAAADRMHESATEVTRAMRDLEDRVNGMLG